MVHAFAEDVHWPRVDSLSVYCESEHISVVVRVELCVPVVFLSVDWNVRWL